MLKSFLDAKVEAYNNHYFIETDPIQIPGRFNQKKDIEISAFLTATIAWGKRSMIIKNAGKLISLMDEKPFEFIRTFSDQKARRMMSFVHRTFDGLDAIYFLYSLKNIYLNHGGLEELFLKGYQRNHSLKDALVLFRKIFFEVEDPGNTSKHVSDVSRGSAAKRLNMFLRWMVRRDMKGVDFGLWKSIAMSDLMLPLDLHSGNAARSLGLLKRKQNDWKAVEELTSVLRTFDPDDPAKYDYALFGLGVFENMKHG